MSNQGMPELIHHFIDNEKQLEDFGEDIFRVANDKFDFKWPKTDRGYRKALWAVIGNNPLLELVPTCNKCKCKSYSFN